MIKIGTYVNRDPNLTASERLRIIKESGFDFVGLGLSVFAEGNLREMLDACEKTGLPVDNVHLTGSNTHSVWADGDAGDAVVSRYCGEIGLCASCGIKTGVAHVTWGLKTPPPVSEIGLTRFERIAERAEKADFSLALENSAYPEYLFAVMDRVSGFKSAKYCFDSGHRNAFTPDRDYLSLFGGRLAVTHLQDNDGKNDLHLMPFDGCAPWPDIAKGLAKTELGRDRITAEIAGTVRRELPGKSAEEIKASLSRIAIIEDKTLLHIYDGGFTAYEDLSYRQKMERLYSAMKKIAEMTEKAKENEG